MDKQEQLLKIRHSCSHVLAQAVQELYKGVQLGIGPAISEGFYYDFGNLKITDEDLPKIEKRMAQIISKKAKFEKTVKTKKDAKAFLKGQKYKLDLLEELQGEISFYKDGDFIDLCKGPHVNSLSEIGAFKLLSVAGAYWKGDEKNDMLTRIYGTAFETKKELDDFLEQRKQAIMRDHRKIGRELELFMFSDIAPGSPLFLPKGMIILKELEALWRIIHDKYGYQEISTPIMVNYRLFEKSGHLEHYKENMFNVKVDKQDFYLKPMNCPESTLVYSLKIRSYRDLPLKLSEIGRLHRNELSGVLGGLFRVRQITMDDAHIYCTSEQIQQEVSEVLELIKLFYSYFNLETKFYLATRPEKALGDKKVWDHAESALSTALKDNKIKYEVKEKDGAFYGPKIDVHVKDAINREWQLGTIQLDFLTPMRFELMYEGADSKKHPVVMIHRAIFGSFERFLGVLIEHYGGHFPLWISPVQVKIMTINERNNNFGEELLRKLKDNGVRAELDLRSETISKKVRDAQVEKVPLMITIGDKEVEQNTVALRTREGKVTFGLKVEEFISSLLKDIEQKK